MPAFRGTRAQFVRSLRLIPLVLASRRPDSLGLRELFWGTVANLMFEAIQREYEVKIVGGSDVAGVAWQELSPATIERRLRAGRTDDRILIETDALIESLTPGTGADPSEAPGQVNRLDPAGVTIGSDVPYADFHQRGVPGRLPARPFMPADPLPPQWERVLEECVERAMVAVIERVVTAGGIP